MRRTDLRKTVKGALTENLLLKLISLLTAIVLWVIVSGQRDAEWSYLFPLELKNVPAHLVITSDIPEFLDVKIQGAKSFMMEINPKQMAVEINVADLKVGSNFFPVNPDHLKVPRGAKITRVNPSYVTLKAEKLAKKEVRIQSDVQGSPAEDFFVDAVDVVPDKIIITGAESEVKGIKSLKTNSIDISNMKESYKTEVALDIIGRKISLLRDQPVTVMVAIKEVSRKYEIKGLAVKVLNSSYQGSLSPPAINLLLEGPKSLIEQVKKENSIAASFDAGGLAPGKHTGPVKIDMPAGLKLLYQYPKNVTLRLKK